MQKTQARQHVQVFRREQKTVVLTLLVTRENIDVACEAVKCVYNESCKCSANRIGIVGGNAKDSADTQCASFCCQ